MMPLFRPHEYHRPNDLREAVWLLSSSGGTRVIAGGTDLLVEKPAEVECLIDILNLGLDYIRKEKDGIHIGAATTLDSIESSAVLSSKPYSVVSEAAGMIATPAVRNMATISGNICNASPAADLPLALMVLDATVKVVGLSGSKIVLIGDFFKDVNITILSEDELLAEVHVPLHSEHSGAAFMKLRHHQTSVDIAIVNVAVRLTCSGNVCEDARIALGAVAKTPVYAKKAERLLVGNKMDEELIQRAAEAASEEAEPIDDVRASAAYRKRMVAVLVRRALEVSLRRCGAWQK
ncbi:FAD binding domain-containing protein [Chloroflexota bacterium]